MSKKKRSVTGIGLTYKSPEPLTVKQAQAFNSSNNLILSGSAGTGKTFVALTKAVDSLMEGKVDRIVIVRSIVPTRNIGFLPGNVDEKCAIYELPYASIINTLFGRADAYSILKQRGFIEFIPTSFVRGTTLDNCCVILDEAQNLTFHESDSVITRLGIGSTLHICGDYYQSDLPTNGLKEFLNIITKIQGFEYIIFTSKDIVRSDLVRDYIIEKERQQYEKSRIKS